MSESWSLRTELTELTELMVVMLGNGHGRVLNKTSTPKGIGK